MIYYVLFTLTLTLCFLCESVMSTTIPDISIIKSNLRRGNMNIAKIHSSFHTTTLQETDEDFEEDDEYFDFNDEKTIYDFKDEAVSSVLAIESTLSEALVYFIEAKELLKKYKNLKNTVEDVIKVIKEKGLFLSEIKEISPDLLKRATEAVEIAEISIKEIEKIIAEIRLEYNFAGKSVEIIENISKDTLSNRKIAEDAALDADNAYTRAYDLLNKMIKYFYATQEASGGATVAFFESMKLNKRFNLNIVPRVEGETKVIKIPTSYKDNFSHEVDDLNSKSQEFNEVTQYTNSNDSGDLRSLDTIEVTPTSHKEEDDEIHKDLSLNKDNNLENGQNNEKNESKSQLKHDNPLLKDIASLTLDDPLSEKTKKNYEGSTVTGEGTLYVPSDEGKVTSGPMNTANKNKAVPDSSIISIRVPLTTMTLLLILTLLSCFFY